ncbi:hypothetical protein GW916_04585 [bacterium]|nr:hypothetical protein [bacterium]
MNLEGRIPRIFNLSLLAFVLLSPLTFANSTTPASECSQILSGTTEALNDANEKQNGTNHDFWANFRPSDIGKKIYAVHATRTLPEKGLIRIGNPYPSFRPAIHWNLGELVRPHSNGTWESEPYAILAPLEDLKNQIMNLFPRDTMTFGDFKLTSTATFVLPYGVSFNSNQVFKIFRYDPKKSSLREAVQRALKQKGAWNIDTTQGGMFDAPAYLHGKNMSSKAFFKPFLSDLADEVTYFAEDLTLKFEIDNFLIHHLTHYFFHPNRNSHIGISTDRLELQLKIFDSFTKILSDQVASRNESEHVTSSFQREMSQLNRWLNFLRADLLVRKEFGKTAFKSPELRDEILSKLDHLEDTLGWYRANLNHLHQVTDLEEESELSSGLGHEIDPNRIAILLTNLNPTQFPVALSEITDFVERAGGPSIVKGFYSLQRFRVLGFEEAEREGSIKDLLRSFNQASKIEKLGLLNLLAHSSSTFFTGRYHTPRKYERFLEFPEVTKFLEQDGVIESLHANDRTEVFWKKYL